MCVCVYYSLSILKYINQAYVPISTQASELLRDMTLGANMRVHLVRMIILSEPEVSSSLLPSPT